MTRRIVAGALLVVLPTLLGACGGGGDSGSSGGECAPPSFDNLGGVWAVRNEISGDCQNELEQFDVFIEQNGAELKFLGRTSFTATMCGTRASADRPISYVRNAGIQTVTNLVLQFQNETSFTGTAQWTWEAGSSVCSGTMSITSIR